MLPRAIASVSFATRTVENVLQTESETIFEHALDSNTSSRQPPASGFSRSEVEGAGAHSKTKYPMAGNPMAAPTGELEPLGLMPRPLRPRSEAIRSTEIWHAPTPQERDAMIEILQRLDRIEAVLVALVKQGQIQEWYDTKAAAKELDKSPYTVRQALPPRENPRREAAAVAAAESKEWRISHAGINAGQGRGPAACPDALIGEPPAETKGDEIDER